nr:putative reverse transcriptase domain-containing protein [Tanacetum cinerariifolium]
VSPDELPGIPLVREVEFNIELIPGSEPISKAPNPVFMDLMNRVFYEFLDKFVIVFIDDILVFSKSKEDHEDHLRTRAFLGHIVSAEGITMDPAKVEAITKWPRPTSVTERRHDAIWVVVDHLTKSAHFLPIRKDYSVSKLAETFQQEIVRLHGTPSAIVSDRDPRFTSRFWKGLQKAWGTRLKFSNAFHPQTDSQSERTIQTLEDMLRSCALESLEFQTGDHVFLKVSSARGVRRFGIKGKLSPRFIGPFEILDRVEQTEFRLDEDDVLWQGTRLCVPNDALLREALLTEDHSSLFSVKIEHQRASGLLQPLDIPVWKWDEISMVFVTGLPRTQRRHDAIWVVVHRLTKSAHFLLSARITLLVSWQRLFNRRSYDYTVLHQRSYQTEIHVSRLVFGKVCRKLGEPGLSSVMPFILRQTRSYQTEIHVSRLVFGKVCRKLGEPGLSLVLPFILRQTVEERVIEGPEMIEVTIEKFAVAKEKLKEAQGTSIILFMAFHIRSIRSVRIYLTSKNLRPFWIVKIESRGTRLFLSSRFFRGTVLSGKPLGKLRSLSGLLILIFFHDLVPRDYNASSAVPCLFIHILCYSLSLYPFTERYAQPYFFSCLIRQRGVTPYVTPSMLTYPWAKYQYRWDLTPRKVLKPRYRAGHLEDVGVKYPSK